MVEVEEVYSKKEKKYRLPSYETINSEFEIYDIETTFILRNVLRKIAEKLEFYIGILGDILQPDTNSLSSMHEIRFFSDEEKASIYALFKQMMKAHRTIIENVLSKEEEDQAAFLKAFLSEWKDIKKELTRIIQRMKESWDKETTMDEQIGYFG